MKNFLKIVLWIFAVCAVFVGAAYGVTKLLDKYGKNYANLPQEGTEDEN